MISPLYRTPAFPPGSGPDFVNAACAVGTDLNPVELLELLHEVEAEFGRQRNKRWAARTLDLDLIACGERVCPDPETVQRWVDLPLEQQMKHAPDQLLLPHPRLQDRAFVLVPLNDIAPDWVHPLTGRTVRQMLAALSQQERDAVKRLVNPRDPS